MKKILISCGVIVAIIIAIFVIFGGEPNIKNYPPKQGPIVAFGDSLVEGVGSSKGNDFVSILSRKINEPIINLGVSGNTTVDGLERIDEVLVTEPRIVIVLLGGNDFLRKVPRKETFDNLKTIVTRIQERGAIVILLGVRGGLFSDSANGLFEELAEETGSAYVSNVLQGLFADSRYMFDAIHPNDTGYIRVADKVYPVLEKLLK